MGANRGIRPSFLVTVLGITVHRGAFTKVLVFLHPLLPENRNFSPRLMMRQCLCLPQPALQKPHWQMALWVPNPAVRRNLETSKAPYTGKAIALYIGLHFSPLWIFLEVIVLPNHLMTLLGIVYVSIIIPAITSRKSIQFKCRLLPHESPLE